MRSPHSKLSRRKFLVTVGAGSAAATVALVAGKSAEQDAVPEKTSPEAAGYRLTEHIRNYYRTTKV